jgi:hypothetical protein
MAMTLTKDDLQAIASVFDERITIAINTLVPPMIERGVREGINKLVPPMIEAAIDDLKLMVAAGFAEIDDRFRDVYARLDRLQTGVDTLQRVQKAEIGRVDKQERHLKHLRQTLRTA